MSGTLIIAGEDVSAITVSSGTGAENLLSRSPREVWAAASTAPQTIDIDLGTIMLIDSFFVGSTNAAPDATWTVFCGSAMGAGLAEIMPPRLCRAADSLGPTHHAFHRLAQPVSGRFFRIQIRQSGADPFYAGRVLLGLAFEQFRELGGGRQPVDTGARSSQSDGGFGMSSGIVKALFNFSFIDLDDNDLRRLWAIAYKVGLRIPCVTVEDADIASGQNEAIHYGVFQTFQPYDRQEPGSSRWAFSHEEWR